MTLGDGRRKVLMLIDEYSSGGTITEDKDLDIRMADFFDLAQKDICNYKKIIRMFTPAAPDPLPGDTPATGFIACPLPDGFKSPFRVWKDGKRGKNYIFTEDAVLLPEADIGSVVIEYFATPATIPPDATDDYEFEVDEDAAACMPYYVAAQQLIVDLVVDYQPLLDMYNRMVSALDMSIPGSGGHVRQAMYSTPRRRF